MRVLAMAVLVMFFVGCSSGLQRPVQEVIAAPGPDGVQHVFVVDTTTISPAVSPDSMAAVSPSVGPSFTVRTVTVLSSLTT